MAIDIIARALAARAVALVRTTTLYDILGVGVQILIDPHDTNEVYQDTVGTTPANIGDAVGKIGRVTSATQGTTSLKPLRRAHYIEHDMIDDYLSFTSNGLPSCERVYAIPGGWMRTESRAFNATTTRVPGGYLRLYLATTALTPTHVDAINSYLGTQEYTFVGMTTDSTVFHRIDSPSGPYTIKYVGNNGVVYNQTSNNVTTDLAAAGLTSPYSMFIPLAVKYDTALTNFYCSNNQLTGSIPSLSTNTALQIFHCYNNQLTGSIPSLTANTALTIFYCYGNQLTGSIPSLTANTALTQFYCFSNQLTGSIPSLTANTALEHFYCYSNQLTGWSGGSVSATLGTFLCENNLLTQAAVDAILAAFDAAGRSSGTRILNLGGTGNAAPSAAGVTSKNNLIAKGWTVTTN